MRKTTRILLVIIGLSSVAAFAVFTSTLLRGEHAKDVTNTNATKSPPSLVAAYSHAQGQDVILLSSNAPNARVLVTNATTRHTIATMNLSGDGTGSWPFLHERGIFILTLTPATTPATQWVFIGDTRVKIAPDPWTLYRSIEANHP